MRSARLRRNGFTIGDPFGQDGVVADHAPPIEQPSAEDPGRGLFDGYEAYRTATDADYHKVLTGGLVVVDTNVLLNLYRYNAQARTDFLGVLRALQPNLWIPDQVIREFWKNRESVLRDPRGTGETLRLLQDQRGKALSQINQWTRLASLSNVSTNSMIKAIEAGFEFVRDAIEEHEDGQNAAFAQDTNSDPVLTELEQILNGRIGPSFGEDEIERLSKEFAQRVEAEIPPGFSDIRKKGVDGAAGDYLLWEQLLRHASNCRRDVLFVTSENKPDWWRKAGGELRGPHGMLVRELHERAGVRLLMLQPDRLLDLAKTTLQVPVHEGSAATVARVASSLADQDNLPTGGWSTEAMKDLLDRLDNEAPVQAAAIRQAAQQGGYISRDEIYALGEYGVERKLKGFTKPVKRITQEFRDQGVIPEEAADVLATNYDHANFGWASGFSLTEELIPLLLNC